MKKTKILVVEDERVTAEDLKLTLENLGYRITGLASSAASFYACIQQGMPDLVLMDIFIEGPTDGITLAAEIKKKFDLPVIFLTAFSDVSILNRAKVTEPYGFILKPFQDRELHSTIEMAIYKSRSEKRITHLNSVLRAIREVNQLIVRVDNKKELIEKACETMISTRGYIGAWITLLDEHGRFSEFSSSGLISETGAFTAALEEGYRPDCFKCLDIGNGITQVRHTMDDCGDCPLKAAYPNTDIFTTRIRFKELHLGYLSVIAPKSMSENEEETGLITEIAEDLGLALSNLARLKNKEEAENALRENEERYRSLIELIPDGIAIHREGKLVFVNASAVRLIGASDPREIIGKPLDNFLHPDCRETVHARIRKTFEGNSPAQLFEELFIKVDGTPMEVEVTAIPFVDKGIRSMFVVFTDITERKKHIDAIVKAKENWEKTFDSIPDLIAIIDKDHRIVKANKAMAAKIGCSTSDAAGCHCYQIVHGMDSIPEFCPHARTINSHKQEHGEVFEERLGGTYHVTTTPIFDDHGALTGSVHVARDVTERKQRELLMMANLALGEYALSHPMEQMLQMTLDKAEELTGSIIGFFHFLDDSEATISLQTWSTNTLNNMCMTDSEAKHYPIDQAGIWVECIRERKPVIHNNYTNTPNRKGMPEGHAPITRELTIPIIRGDKVVAIIGVGNKPAHYNETDVDILTQLANFVWEYIVSKRLDESLKKKVTELEWFNRMMVDRELKMIELKKEVNVLSNRIGEGDRYIIHHK